jgi:heme exporter protein D
MQTAEFSHGLDQVGAHMSEWGFFDWLAYGTTWVAAIVIAISGAIKIEPNIRQQLPRL